MGHPAFGWRKLLAEVDPKHGPTNEVSAIFRVNTKSDSNAKLANKAGPVSQDNVLSSSSASPPAPSHRNRIISMSSAAERVFGIPELLEEILLWVHEIEYIQMARYPRASSSFKE
jgi:hypothetical protein